MNRYTTFKNLASLRLQKSASRDICWRDLIESGVARGVVYDSYRAGKEQDQASTGHALPAPNAFGPFPLNIFFAPGKATVDEMIASTERGLYVTRFHYTRPVEPSKVVITGMTRDGVMRFENGEIVGAAFIEASVCQGCGSCAAECPAGAIQLTHYSDRQVWAKIDGLVDTTAGFIPLDQIAVSEGEAG